MSKLVDIHELVSLMVISFELLHWQQTSSCSLWHDNWL